MMPGTRLMHFASRWFPPSTVSSVFEPLVADWQRQWNDASPAERRWINAKGFAAFATTTVMLTPRVILASPAFSTRPLAVAAGFWLVTSSLLTLPFAQYTPPNLLWLLLPGTLTMMLPFAILPAIDALRRDCHAPAPSERRAAFALVIMAALAVIVGQGWITPAANQRYRAEVAHLSDPRVAPYPGLREMTTAELITGDATNTPALYGVPRVRELSNRLMLALLPAVLGWLRWRSLSGARNRSGTVLRSCLLAVAATVAFLATMPAGPALERMFLAPGIGPLLALALFASTVRTGIWWRQRSA